MKMKTSLFRGLRKPLLLQVIRVQIRDDVTSDDSVVIHHDGTSQRLTNEAGSPMVELSTPNHRQHTTTGHIKMSRHMFNFAATRIGRKSGTITFT